MNHNQMHWLIQLTIFYTQSKTNKGFLKTMKTPYLGTLQSKIEGSLYNIPHVAFYLISRPPSFFIPPCKLVD